jgi:hypothetical protein
MQATEENVNFFIATLTKNNYKATDIHHLLANAWGEDNIIKVRQIQKKASQFATGERVEFTHKKDKADQKK